MQNLTVFLFVQFILLSFEGNINDHADIRIPMDAVVLCSGENGAMAGRCTGSAYCKVCKDCSRCGHCNSGGSCGVCGKTTQRSFGSPSKPRPKKKIYRPSSSPKKKKQQVVVPDAPTFNATINGINYIVIRETSLRKLPSSKSDVIRRFKIGDEVSLIESNKKDWWKVNFKGSTGWVKSALLKQK